MSSTVGKGFRFRGREIAGTDVEPILPFFSVMSRRLISALMRHCRRIYVERFGTSARGTRSAEHDWVVELPDRFMCVYVAAADTLKLS